MTAAILCGVIGPALLFRALHILGRASASKDWKVARGKLAKCKVREERVHTRYGTRSTWHVDVLYRFDLDGKRYSGHRRFWSEPISLSNFTAQMTARALKRKPVKVLYNPEDPDESILYPGHAGNLTVHLIAGTTLLVLAAALLSVRLLTS